MRMQVADFMADAVIVAREATVLGRACFKLSKQDAADEIVSAVLALPQHLLHAILSSLLAARVLPELLDALSAALHRSLMQAVLQRSGADDASAREPSGTAAAVETSESGQVATSAASLHLLPGAYSDAACAAVVACIPLLPPLGAVMCGAALPPAPFIYALSVHAALTQLDISGAGVFATRAGARTFADALPSWPHLRSLCLCEHNCLISPIGLAMLLPALANASELTALDLSFMPVSIALACAVSTLTRLVKLQLTRCRRAAAFIPHLASLPRLRTLCAQHVAYTVTDEPRRDGASAPAGVAACASLTHLDLRHSLRDVAGLELAALPQLASLQLEGCSLDSSLSADDVSPFVADERACRYGLRALPHLQVLTAMSFGGYGLANNRAHLAVGLALAVALPLLPNLAQLALQEPYSEQGANILAKGWAHLPNLCALTCVAYINTTLLHTGVPSNAPRLRALTSLDMVMIKDAFVELEGTPESTTVRVPWLSGQIASLTALRKLRIHNNVHQARNLVVQSTLAVLSALTDLRRLELARADTTGVNWRAATFRALSALSLTDCAESSPFEGALAALTQLRVLVLRNCGIWPGDALSFVRQRAEALKGAPDGASVQLDLDFAGGHDHMSLPALKHIMQLAEQADLRTLTVSRIKGSEAVQLVAAFNAKWGRRRRCECRQHGSPFF